MSIIQIISTNSENPQLNLLPLFLLFRVIFGYCHILPSFNVRTHPVRSPLSVPDTFRVGLFTNIVNVYDLFSHTTFMCKILSHLHMSRDFFPASLLFFFSLSLHNTTHKKWSMRLPPITQTSTQFAKLIWILRKYQKCLLYESNKICI